MTEPTTPAAPATRSRRRAAIAATLLTCALIAGFFAWRGTVGAFTATTDNRDNQWRTGTVFITASSPATSYLGSATPLPGDAQVTCVVATYTGTLDALVTLYRDSYTDPDGVGADIDLTIDATDGDTSGSCATFTGTRLYTGTMAAFARDHADQDSGVGSWAATPNSARTYRFTATLRPEAPNTAQGKSVGLAYAWVARSA